MGRAGRFLLLSIAGIYVQYFVAFMLPGFFCLLLMRRRWKAVWTFVAFGVVVAAAALPLALVARSQVEGYAVEAPSRHVLVQTTAEHPWIEFLYPIDFSWSDVTWFRDAYGVMAIAFGITVVASLPRKSAAWAHIAAASTVEIMFLALVVIIDLPLSDRYFVAIYVPEMVAAYSAFCALRRGPRPIVSWAFAPTVLLTAVLLISRYRFLAQNGDWGRVAAYLSKNARAGDVIAVFPADALPALDRQYHGTVPRVAFPKPFSTTQYSVADLTLGSDREGTVALKTLRRYRRIWLVDSEKCFHRHPVFGCEYIPDIVASGRGLERESFFGSAVYLFGPSPGSGAQAGAQTVRQIGESRHDQVERAKPRQAQQND